MKDFCHREFEPDRFDIVEDFEYNGTPRLRREVRPPVLRLEAELAE